MSRMNRFGRAMIVTACLVMIIAIGYELLNVLTPAKIIIAGLGCVWLGIGMYLSIKE